MPLSTQIMNAGSETKTVEQLQRLQWIDRPMSAQVPEYQSGVVLTH